MGLFSSSGGPCHFCDGKVTEGNGLHCDSCGTYAHTDCMKRNNLIKEDKKLIRSNKIKVKCPGCGVVSTI